MESSPQPQPKIELNLDQWADYRWRLSNLYWIVTDDGKVMPFRPNEMQLKLLEEFWYLNVILKARQHGFTTLIDLMALDLCVFNSNQTAGIIAHNLDDAEKIFRRKVMFPYKRLPDGLRQARELEKDTGKELVFNNGSSVSVGTSMRSGTLQFLHVSEFGKIAAKYPEKAREIVTGAFNTVHPGQFIFVESSAEGRGGRFFDMTQKAQKLGNAVRNKQARMTELDFKFHFFAWWQNPKYQMDPRGVVLSDHYTRYFAELAEQGITLTAEQKAWYVKKSGQMVEEGESDDDMKREYPSTPEEAFQASVAGAIYAQQMAQARKEGRICKVRVLPIRTHTFWDIGKSDNTSIWFLQKVGIENRWIDCYEERGKGIDHFVKVIQDKNYLMGKFYLPHDAENVLQVTITKQRPKGQSIAQQLQELLPNAEIIIVPRVEDIQSGIQQVRRSFPTYWFDEERCVDGLAALENYHFEWNEKLQVFGNNPVHDWTADYADAIRQHAQSEEAGGGPSSGQKFKRNKMRTGWRTA